MNWHIVSTQPGLNEDFMEEHAEQLVWDEIAKHQTLSPTFIEKYKHKLDTHTIIRTQKLTESFIENHVNPAYWEDILEHQTLTETFLRKYAPYLDWNTISRCQKLSESFMEDYDHKIVWLMIAQHQEMSFDFVRKYVHELFIPFVQANKKCHFTKQQWEEIKRLSDIETAKKIEELQKRKKVMGT